MKAWTLAPGLAAILVLSAVACSDDDTSTNATGTGNDGGTSTGTKDASVDAGPFDTTKLFSYCAGKNGPVLDFAAGEEQALLDAVNQLPECAVVRLGAGTFKLPNAITIRQKGIYLVGAGKGAKGELTGTGASTVLDFTSAVANANGVDHVGDWFTIEGVAIVGAPNNALRVESSTNVRIRSVRAEWKAENAATNGKYGLYPVKSTNVLLEDSEAYNASDAGIYVGQTTNTIVRNNVAKQNVAGIEIENTLHADVYGNLAEDNTTGLVVFDLPGNPTAGTDVYFHDNTVKDNNRANFGASTVGQVPAGTGTFVMASRRVEITKNTYSNNNTTDIAVISGLSLDPKAEDWAPSGNNFLTKDVWVHGNTIQGGSGDNVDNGHADPDARPLGAVLAGLYAYGAAAAGTPNVEPFVWDGVGTSPTTDDALINDVNLCVTDNTLPAGAPATSIVDLDLPFSSALAKAANFAGAWGKTSRVAQGVTPFNCTGFTPALPAVTLPE